MHTDVNTPSTLSEGRLFATVVACLFIVLFATADRSIPYHIDPFTNVLTADTLASSGSPILDDYSDLQNPEYLGVFAWVVESPRGPVSQYPPGASLWAVPFYLFAPSAQPVEIVATNDTGDSVVNVPIPTLWPAAIAGSLAVALAAGFTALSIRSLGGSSGWAIGSTVVLVAGTGLWLNGAYQLWQHGVSSMWISIGMWSAVTGRWKTSGLGFALAILTRPPVALVAAAVGIHASLRSRSWRPVVEVGTVASVGFGALLAYNYWLLGTLSISGGYSSAFSERLIDTGLVWYVQNILGGLFSLQMGLFVWSPIVLLGLIAVRRIPDGWRNPALGGLIGGVVLLLVQYRLNRFSGGDGFYSYRYPLESLAASAPALSVALLSWNRNRITRLLLVGGVSSSVLFHLAALLGEYELL